MLFKILEVNSEKWWIINKFYYCLTKQMMICNIYILVYLTMARVKSEVDILFTISKWTALAKKEIQVQVKIMQVKKICTTLQFYPDKVCLQWWSVAFLLLQGSEIGSLSTVFKCLSLWCRHMSRIEPAYPFSLTLRWRK